MLDSRVINASSLRQKISQTFEKRELILGVSFVMVVSILSIAITMQGWRSRITAFDLLPYIYGIRDFLMTGAVPQFGDIGSYGSYSPPGTAWLFLPGAMLFKDPRLMEYLGAALLHILTLLCIYLLARDYFGVWCAVLAALLYGFGESALFYAGSLWPIGRPDFYIWVVYLTSRWVARRDSRYLAAALAVWGFGMYVDMALLPVFFIFPALWLYYRPPVRLRYLIVAGVVILLAWLPYLGSEVSRGFADLRSQLLLQPIFPSNYRLSWCDPNLVIQRFQGNLSTSQTGVPVHNDTGLLVALIRVGHETVRNALTNFGLDSLVPESSYLLLFLTLSSLLFLSVPGFTLDNTGPRDSPPFRREWLRPIAMIMSLSGLVIIGLVFAYLQIFKNGAQPGPKSLLVLKIQVILVVSGIALLVGPWLIAKTNDLLVRMRVNIQTAESVERIRLLVFSLIIPWMLLLLLAEPGKPERFMWLWPLQSIFLAAFFTNILPRFKLPRVAIWSLLVIVIFIVLANPFTLQRLDAWQKTGWAGPEADEIKVVDYLGEQLEMQHKGQAAIGYQIFFYPFMAEYNVLSPIYKIGAEIDLLLLSRQGIINSNQCAEGITTHDEYRIVEISPKPWTGSPRDYFGLPADDSFHLVYEAGNFQVLKHD